MTSASKDVARAFLEYFKWDSAQGIPAFFDSKGDIDEIATTTIELTLPDGSKFSKDFKRSRTIWTVCVALCEANSDIRGIAQQSLVFSTGGVDYGMSKWGISLKDLGLVPKGSFVVSKK